MVLVTVRSISCFPSPGADPWKALALRKTRKPVRHEENFPQLPVTSGWEAPGVWVLLVRLGLGSGDEQAARPRQRIWSKILRVFTNCVILRCFFFSSLHVFMCEAR